MDPELKKLLNSLRCPICKGRIDVMRRGYACAANNDHYQINFFMHTVQISTEIVNIRGDGCKYVLIKTYSPSGQKIQTEIVIMKIDPEGRIEYSHKKKSLVLDQDLFDFRNFNPDRAVNRIKTIFAFY